MCVFYDSENDDYFDSSNKDICYRVFSVAGNFKFAFTKFFEEFTRGKTYTSVRETSSISVHEKTIARDRRKDDIVSHVINRCRKCNCDTNGDAYFNRKGKSF
jgi:hypothetical protein